MTLKLMWILKVDLEGGFTDDFEADFMWRVLGPFQRRHDGVCLAKFEILASPKEMLRLTASI